MCGTIVFISRTFIFGTDRVSTFRTLKIPKIIYLLIWLFNRSWIISTTKFFVIIFLLILQANWSLGWFAGISGWKTQLSVINWTFFSSSSNFDFSSRGNSEYHIRLLYKLENNQKKLLVLGVVDMHQFLLKQIKAKRQIS